MWLSVIPAFPRWMRSVVVFDPLEGSRCERRIPGEPALNPPDPILSAEWRCAGSLFGVSERLNSRLDGNAPFATTRTIVPSVIPPAFRVTLAIGKDCRWMAIQTVVVLAVRRVVLFALRRTAIRRGAVPTADRPHPASRRWTAGLETTDAGSAGALCAAGEVLSKSEIATHYNTASPVAAYRLAPSAPTPDGSAHMPGHGSGDWTAGLRASRKPETPEKWDGPMYPRLAEPQRLAV